MSALNAVPVPEYSATAPPMCVNACPDAGNQPTQAQIITALQTAAWYAGVLQQEPEPAYTVSTSPGTAASAGASAASLVSYWPLALLALPLLFRRKGTI
jgi:hypothetical protein